MTQPRSLLPTAEAALVALSLAVVLGFGRLFNDGSFFPKLAAFALVAHGGAIVARRAGWSVAVSGALSLVLLGVTIGIVLYPGSTVAGVPTGETVQLTRADLAEVWGQFQSVQAPTPVTTTFLLAAGLALWWSAFVADWAAFRVWVPFESVVPAGTVFVFSSLFAAKKSQVELAGVFLIAAMIYLLIHRVTRQQSSSGWVSTDVQRGTNAMLRVGTALAVVAVVAAMVVGPNLPQAHSAAIFSWRGGGSGPSARTTVSPLVDIGHRLVDQSGTELFTVRSDRRSYWRLTALDQFDGQIWKSDGSYERASGRLPKSDDSIAAVAQANQGYFIESLDTIWLPAAYVPRSVNNASTEVRYEPGTSTMIVGTDVVNSNSVGYNVLSEIPLFDPQQLASVPAQFPQEILDHDLLLPADFSQRVVLEAENAVAGTTNNYEKALALQDYFRNNFAYDLTVGPGHGESAIERFLFDTKRGYCEQFAGTYAAMARALGLPSRVAVGFTPGDEDPIFPGTYHVRGLHAHVWPEVYFPGQGWVLFEPTPTRGAPNAEQYTNVVEEQASGGGPATTAVSTTVPTTAPSDASAATPTTAASQPQSTPVINRRSEPSFWSTERLGGKALVTVGLVIVLALLYVASVLAFHALGRQRRRRAASAPDERVRLAWQESVESFGLLGVAPRRSETPAEFGVRASSTVAIDGFAELSTLLVQSSYSAEGATSDDANRVDELSESVSAAVKAKAPASARIRAALDPRPPDRRRPVSRRGPANRRRGDAPLIEILRLD